MTKPGEVGIDYKEINVHIWNEENNYHESTKVQVLQIKNIRKKVVPSKPMAIPAFCASVVLHRG